MPSLAYPESTLAKDKYIKAQEALKKASYQDAIKLIKEVAILEPTFKPAHDLWLVWSVDYAKLGLSPTEMQEMHDLYRKYFDKDGTPLTGSKESGPLA